MQSSHSICETGPPCRRKSKASEINEGFVLANEGGTIANFVILEVFAQINSLTHCVVIPFRTIVRRTDRESAFSASTPGNLPILQPFIFSSAESITPKQSKSPQVGHVTAS